MKPLRRFISGWRGRSGAPKPVPSTKPPLPRSAVLQRRNRRILGSVAAGGLVGAFLLFLGLRPQPVQRHSNGTRVPHVEPHSGRIPILASESGSGRLSIPRLPRETFEEFQQRVARERQSGTANPNTTTPNPYVRTLRTRFPVYELEESLRYITRERLEMISRIDLSRPNWVAAENMSLQDALTSAQNAIQRDGLVQVEITSIDPRTNQPIRQKTMLYVEKTENGSLHMRSFGPLTNDPQFDADKSHGWKATSTDLATWLQLNSSSGVQPQIIETYAPQP